MATKQKEPVQAQEQQAETPDIDSTPVEPEKRKMPTRIEPVELEGDYEGWRFFANRNFTFGEMEDLASFNYVRMAKALKLTVTGWENFVDREGNTISFVSYEELTKAQQAYDAWVAKRNAAPAGEFRLAPMLQPKDPWAEVTTDLIYNMSRAVLGLPLPNK